jgi:hypothetical protein
MPHITTEVLRGLLDPVAAPAVSLYQPTHRANPDNAQDPIRYKNLLTRVERSLAEKHPAREVDALLEPMRGLLDDYTFWTHQEDGLAMFRSADAFHVYQLQRPVAELVVVADSFHVKPMIRLAQSADRYEVLCLDRRSFRIFEGNRDVLDEVKLDDVPATIDAALDEELAEPNQTVTSFSGSSPTGQGDPGFPHAQGGRKDEVDKDTERFFRFVDREVEKRFSKPSGQPLLLVALAEHQADFRRVSRNAALLPEGVTIDPKALKPADLRERAWKAIEPGYFARLDALTERFQAAQAAGKAVSKVAEAAREAATGRIATLLVEADRVVPGKLDLEKGKIQKTHDLDDPGVDDLIDDLAEGVLRMKGDVVVVPADKMPTDTGLAAILRY